MVEKYGFLPTVSVRDDDPDSPGSSSSEEESSVSALVPGNCGYSVAMHLLQIAKPKKKNGRKSEVFAKDFTFFNDDSASLTEDPWEALRNMAKKGTVTSLDEKIAITRKKKRQQSSEPSTELKQVCFYFVHS